MRVAVRRQWTNRRVIPPPSSCKKSCTSWQLMAFLGVEQVTCVLSSTLAPNTSQLHGYDKDIASGHCFINIRSSWAGICSHPKKKPRRTVDLTALLFPTTHFCIISVIPIPSLYVSGERGEIGRIALSRAFRAGGQSCGPDEGLGDAVIR